MIAKPFQHILVYISICTGQIPYEKSKSISTSTAPGTLAAGCAKVRKFHCIRRLTVAHYSESHEL